MFLSIVVKSGSIARDLAGHVDSLEAPPGVSSASATSSQFGSVGAMFVAVK
jgi:hypothetical protein